MRETTTAPLIAWSRTFPAVPQQARKARRFLAEILDGRPADDAILCLSESVTNACLHSASAQRGGLLAVRVQLHGTHLRVEIRDEGGPWAEGQPEDTQGEGAACSSWTAWPTPGDAAEAVRPAGPPGSRWTRAHDGRPARHPETRQRRKQRSDTPVLDHRRRWHTAAPSPSQAWAVPGRTGREGRDQPDHAGPAGAAAQDAVPLPYPRPPCSRTGRGPGINNLAASQLTTVGTIRTRSEDFAREFHDTEWRTTAPPGTRRQ